MKEGLRVGRGTGRDRVRRGRNPKRTNIEKDEIKFKKKKRADGLFPAPATVESMRAILSPKKPGPVPK